MTDLKNFITRVVAVQALQLSLDNFEEAAALCGGKVERDTKKEHGFVLFVPSPMGPIIARPGMWLIKNAGGWVAMTYDNFQRKYEPANHKGERVPPYSKVDLPIVKPGLYD